MAISITSTFTCDRCGTSCSAANPNVYQSFRLPTDGSNVELCTSCSSAYLAAISTFFTPPAPPSTPSP